MKRYFVCTLHSDNFSRIYVREIIGLYNEYSLVLVYCDKFEKEFDEKPMHGTVVIQDEDYSIHFDNVFIVVNNIVTFR